jgi:hypothetical protein
MLHRRCVFVCVCVYICMYTCGVGYAWTCICVCVYIYIYIYADMHAGEVDANVHTYIHKYIHTQTTGADKTGAESEILGGTCDADSMTCYKLGALAPPPTGARRDGTLTQVQCVCMYVCVYVYRSSGGKETCHTHPGAMCIYVCVYVCMYVCR